MVLSDKEVRAYTARLLHARHRVLTQYPFYGLLLMHLRFSLDESCETAYTDGERIAFSPAFLDALSDSEVDFVLMHEVLHVALAHCARGTALDPTVFNVACDIVVNSNILLASGMHLPAITLAAYGEAMHKAPDGREGHLYTAEEVYRMLVKDAAKTPSPQGGGDGQGSGTNGGSGGERGKTSPQRGKGGAAGDAPQRTGKKKTRQGGEGGEMDSPAVSAAARGRWDDHSRWGGSEEDDGRNAATWRARVANAAAVLSVNDPSNTCGSVPLCVERLLKEWHRSRVDWRTALQEFVQEEIADWSFSPPDRRFPDSPFFLPDLSGTVDTVKNILFMIDTSGSMSDGMIAAAYAEICAAIDQFGGALAGYLGFFDAVVVPPVPFSAVEDVRAVRPVGGGGTSFRAVFRYVREQLRDEPPSCLIILTDGYAPFPDADERGDIPVLWLINNEEIDPPFGKVARIDDGGSIG